MRLQEINGIKSPFNISIKKNINFAQTYSNYSYAPKGTYLPHNQEVYLSKNSVLALAGKRDGSMKGSYILGLDNDRIRFLFDFFNFDTVTVGREGNLQVPQESYPCVSNNHIVIKRYGNEGFLVKDTSTNGTQVTGYFDYTNVVQNTPLPFAKEVLINKDAILELSQNTILNLNSPQIQRKFDYLEPNKTYTIGREGDISLAGNDFTVSRQHLEITKLDNYYVVKDISMNGTKILHPGKSTMFNNAQRSYNYAQGSQHQYYGQYQNRNNYRQQNYQQRASQETDPKFSKSVSKEQFDCTEECQRDLEKFLDD